MSCLLGLVVGQSFCGPRFESQLKQLFFSYNFLLGEYFYSSKCPGPAVAKFVLIINTLVVNRVNSLLKTVARSQRRYLFRTKFFFFLVQVGTCLRVQELKKLCFYLLSFLRYEAKSNDDSSFSQF